MKNKIIYTLYGFIGYLLFCLGVYALPLPDISAQGAILIEPTTNTVLYSKNANEKFYPASTTKILTCLILIEEMSPQEILTKSAESINNVPSDSSHIGLIANDKYSYLDGLYAILMGSDNYVSYDMANLNAGSQQDFVLKMNEKAKELGAYSSNFVNPHGYHDPNHYTTPYDLAQIAIGAFGNDTLSKVAGTPEYDFTILNTGQTIPLEHTALLLDKSSPYYNSSVTGVKTGYHTPAGRTLVAKAVYDNIELIGVVMKTNSPNQFIDMNELFEYGHQNFNTLSLGESGSYIENVSYSSWAKDSINYALSEGWIPRSTRNYMSPISATEFISLLQKAINIKQGPSLYQYNTDPQLSMYHMNTPITRMDAAYIIYKLCNTLELRPYRFYDQINIPDTQGLPSYYQQAINYTTSTKILGSPTDPFNPTGNLTYEHAIVIAHKLNKLFNTTTPYIFMSLD